MTQRLEIHTIPVINTAHVTEEVSRRLSDGSGQWCACAKYKDYGFFLYLDEPHGTALKRWRPR